MNLEEDIRQMVLSMDGVATVYAADPVWLSALKQLGSLMDPDSAAQPVPFVVCSEAASSETDTGDAGSTGGSSCRSVMTVKIRIGTDGALRAPDMARSVAGAIRTFVTALHPDVQVKAVVEISAIGV
ncbi:hypothetical protein [Specibacter sp. NPDC078692]|uniref:hypothetical protein n=1 Tax=Specibacter sp. NPDC078692 TaxID=3155818 RepID=UPI00341AB277